MKPRTKFQKATYDLMVSDPDATPALTEAQKLWARQLKQLHKRIGIRDYSEEVDFLIFRTYKGLQQILRYAVIRRDKTIMYKLKVIDWLNEKGQWCQYVVKNKYYNYTWQTVFTAANNQKYLLVSHPPVEYYRYEYVWEDLEMIPKLTNKCIPEISWFHVIKYFSNVYPFSIGSVIRALLLDKYIVECTIIKEHYEMLFLYLKDGESFDRFYKTPYKIAVRHRYVPSDWRLWIDMIDLLRNAEKDLHNPKFVCPPDIAKMHDYALKEIEKNYKREKRKRLKNGPFDLDWFGEFAMNQEIFELFHSSVQFRNELLRSYSYPKALLHDVDWFKERGESRVATYLEYYDDYEKDNVYKLSIGCIPNNGEEDDYGIRLVDFNEFDRLMRCQDFSSKQEFMTQEDLFQKKKSIFSDLCFEDNELKIMTLNSVKEYIDEAHEMHNCIAALKYYLKENSLIMSARVEGKSVADVEVDLRNFQIRQCYGPFNKRTPYADRIKKLIADNVHLIQERMSK